MTPISPRETPCWSRFRTRRYKNSTRSKARMGWTFDPMAWLRLRDQYEPASGTAARCRS